MMLCASLLCLSLCSCTALSIFEWDSMPPETAEHGNDKDGDPDPNDTESEPMGDRLEAARKENAAAFAAAPDGDFGGMSFIVTSSWINNLFGTSEGRTELSREKYIRQKTLSEKYNTEIVQTQAYLGGIEKGLSDSKASGMVYTHLLAVSAYYVGTLSYKGLIGSINALPYVNTDRPYYDADFCENMRTPTGLYALYGDACRDETSFWTVLYNRTLTERAGIFDIEQTVKSGDFTVDMLCKYIKMAEPDDAEKDDGYFSVVCEDRENAIESFYVSCKMNSVSLSEKELKVNDNAERGDELVRMMKLLFDPADTRWEDIDYMPEQIFLEGKAAFYITVLNSSRYLSGMSDVWGILPMPSLYENDGYRSALSRSTTVICYPGFSVHTNEIGMMTEALFACSYKILDAVLFDELLHKHVRMEAALDMIDIILDSTVCDMTLLYADEYANFRAGTKDAFFQSYYDDVLYSERFYERRYAADRSLTYVK